MDRRSNSIFAGAKFASSDEFLERIKTLEDESHCSFVFKNSTKAETDNKTRKRAIDERKFSISRGTVACAHYGAKRHHPSKGIKTSSKSQKLNCSASFSFKYDDFQQCILITKCNLVHNHHSDERTYSQEHKQKKFTDQEKSVIREMVALNPDNDKLMVLIQRDFNKSVTLRDVRALKSKLKYECKGTNFAALSNQLKSVEEMGGKFHLALSTDGGESHLIDMIAFSTKDMLACFHSFPECIFIDGTYKKNNTGFPLYQIMVEDCLGTARPVLYAFVRNETVSTITLVLRTFEEFVGETLQKTKVVMSDKCPSEASAIQTVLPSARHLLCHWHVYAAMEKRVRSLNLPKDKKQSLSHLLCQLRTTTDPSMFHQLEGEMEALSPDYFSYYCQYWRSCRSQWAACDRLNILNFLNDTNNFVESENRRLGSFLCSSKGLAASVYHLHNHALVRLNELSQAIVKEGMSSVSYQHSRPELEHIYGRFFSYAAKAMIQDHKNLDSLLVCKPGDGIYIITEPSGARFKLIIKEDGLASCHCPFHVQMALPCRHIMACYLDGMDALVFSDSNRWLKSRGYAVSTEQGTGGTNCSVSECVPAEQRHYQTEALMAMLSNVLKSSGGSEYNKRRAVLQKVLSLWEDGKEVCVQGEEDNYDLGGVEGAGGNAVVNGENVVECDVPVVNCDVPVVECDVPVVNCDVPVVECDVPVVNCDVPVVNCDVPVVNCDVPVVECDVPVVECDVPVVNCVVVECDVQSEVVGHGGARPGDAEVSIRRGAKRQAQFMLDDIRDLNVSIPTIRTRGRPSKPRASRRKLKRARPVFINENICHVCLRVEVDKQLSNETGYDDWTRCTLCVRWCHDACILKSGGEKTNFICKYH